MLVGREAVREEELEEALVAQLQRERLVRAQPRVQRLVPGRREVVLAPRATVCGRVPPADQALFLQAAQLRIDLAVARGPEEPRGHIHQLLDLVAGPPAVADHSADDACRRTHVSARYIAPIHMSTEPMRPDPNSAERVSECRGLAAIRSSEMAPGSQCARLRPSQTITSDARK